jgi:hypothetical protein
MWLKRKRRSIQVHDGVEIGDDIGQQQFDQRAPQQM